MRVCVYMVEYYLLGVHLPPVVPYPLLSKWPWLQRQTFVPGVGPERHAEVVSSQAKTGEPVPQGTDRPTRKSVWKGHVFPVEYHIYFTSMAEDRYILPYDWSMCDI